MAAFEIRSRLNYNTENFFSENFTEAHSFKKKKNPKNFNSVLAQSIIQATIKVQGSVAVQQRCFAVKLHECFVDYRHGDE